MYQSKANLDVNILANRITHLLHPEIRKVLGVCVFSIYFLNGFVRISSY